MQIKPLLALSLLTTFSQLHASEINVADFGVLPDGKDDTAALKKALKACKDTGATRLVFPKGSYDFHPLHAEEKYFYISNNDEGLKRIAFSLDEMENLTIDGQGSEFIFHGFINPFILDHSKNITLTNFSIDMPRTFHSEGIIIGDPEEGLDLEIRDGFPFTLDNGTLLFTDGEKSDEPLTTVTKAAVYGSSHMLEFDTEKRETAYMAPDFYYSGINGYPAVSLGGRKVRILVPMLTGTIGNTMVFGPNHRNHPGFVISDSENTVFENVTIHHAGGMGILGQRSHNVTVNNCNVTPSHGRMLSTTADATHFVNMTGKITLTNNLFENPKDDATNIHGIYVQVREKVAPKVALIQHMHAQQYNFNFMKPGTKVELVRGKSMITYAEATVEAVEVINKELTQVTFTEALPEDLLVGDAIAELREYPEILIAHNTIQKNRARGMLLNCRGKTVVENNYFHSPGTAILFEGDSSFWFEQGGVRDCTIRNNTFDNCMFGVWGTAVIEVRAGILEDHETSRYNKNVLIEGNTFRSYDNGSLLNTYCVDGLIWRNNTVEKTTDYPARNEKFETFVTEYCDNVSIEETTD